jgi:hypothetical protein
MHCVEEYMTMGIDSTRNYCCSTLHCIVADLYITLYYHISDSAEAKPRNRYPKYNYMLGCPPNEDSLTILQSIFKVHSKSIMLHSVRQLNQQLLNRQQIILKGLLTQSHR